MTEISMKGLSLIILLILILSTASKSQVKVTYLDNNVYYGFKVSENKDTLKLLDKDKSTLESIPKSSIFSIEEINCYLITENNDVYHGKIVSLSSDEGIIMKLHDSTQKTFDFASSSISFQNQDIYPYIGAMIGAPINIAFTGGVHFSSIMGASLLGGYNDEKESISLEFSLFYNLLKTIYLESNIGLSVGQNYDTKDSYDYVGNTNSSIASLSPYYGIYADINYHGLYFILGTKLNNKTPFFTNIGYVYRFND